MATLDPKRTGALLQAQGRVRSSLIARLVALIVGMLTAYRRGPKSPDATARLVAQLVAAFEQGEKAGASLGSSLVTATTDPTARRGIPGAPQPLTERERLEGEVEQVIADWLADPESGVVERSVAEHVDTAQRSGVAKAGASVKNIIGWRRVIHPELSQGGTCGLCVAAATRIYTTGNLEPIHEHCQCAVLPITTDSDPGDALNRLDMGDLYDDAGNTTDGWTLKQTRYKVNADGDLEAVKVRTKQGPRESMEDIQKRAAEGHAAKARPTVTKPSGKTVESQRAQLDLLQSLPPAKTSEAAEWRRRRIAEIRKFLGE